MGEDGDGGGCEWLMRDKGRWLGWRLLTLWALCRVVTLFFINIVLLFRLWYTTIHDSQKKNYRKFI